MLGLYTVGVQIADRFVFWLPMYCEAKVAFVVYLWHPRTQGALYVYDAFVAPFLAKHEPDIDRRIDETRASVGGVVVRALAKRDGLCEGEVCGGAHGASAGGAAGGRPRRWVRGEERHGGSGDGVHSGEETLRVRGGGARGYELARDGRRDA